MFPSGFRTRAPFAPLAVVFVPATWGLALGALAALLLLAAAFWLLTRLLRENGSLLMRLDALERPVEAPRPPPAAPMPEPRNATEGTLPTLIAASVSTVRMDLLTKRWSAEGRDPYGPQTTHQGIVLHGFKEHYHLVADGELAPAFLAGEEGAGRFMVYDWTTRTPVWEKSWSTMLMAPFGYCFADGSLYLVDQWGCGIFQVDVRDEPGRLRRRISHPYLNDVHSVTRTRRGLLVTSSGTDLIIELDLDGNSLYEWWATEHGYTSTPSGETRVSGRGQEHRDRLYHSMYHTTHVNEATFRDAEERFLVAVLFLQGQVVQIDRSLPAEQQKPQVLVDQLYKPHGLRRTRTGWMVTGSASNEVLLLDEAFRVVDRVSHRSAWIHDCTMLSSGDLLLNDSYRSQLVQLAGPPWRIVSATPYPRSWRLVHLEELPPAYQEGFRQAAAVTTTDEFGDANHSVIPSLSRNLVAAHTEHRDSSTNPSASSGGMTRESGRIGARSSESRSS